MSVREKTPDHAAVGGWNVRLVVILVALILPSELTFIAFAYPLNASLNIATEFQTTQVAWLQTAFALTAAVTATLTGKIADQFGKKRTLLAVLVCVVAGSVIAAFAPSFGIMMIGRALQGPALSVPFLLPALIRDTFPRRTVPLAVSVSACGAGIVSIFASLSVGTVIDSLGWRATYWIPAALGVAIVLLVIAVVPEGAVRTARSSLDVPGALLLGAGVGAVLVAISMGPTWGWTSGRTLGLAILGAALLVAWWLRSLRVDHPLIDLRDLARLPVLMTLGIASIAIAVSTWFFVIMPLIALTPGTDWGLGLGHDGQSVLASTISAGQFIAGFLVGRALARVSAPTVALGVMALSSIAYVVATLGLQNSYLFGLAALLVGVVGGAGYAIAYNLVILVTEPEKQATMSAVVTLGGNLLSAVLPVCLFTAMNSMATLAPDGVNRIYPENAIWVATLVPAGLGLVGIVLGLILRRSGRFTYEVPALAEPAQA